MLDEDSPQVALPASLDDLQVELSAQRSYNVALRTENQELRHENLLLMRKLYGVRTEQTGTTEQHSLFAEMATENAAVAEALAQSAAARALAAPKPKAPAASPKGRRDFSKSKLPRIEVEIASAALDAQGVPRVGFDMSYEVAAQKASYTVIVKKTIRYAETRETSDATTVSAKAPPRVCEGSLFHETMLAKIILEKFALGTTLYRMERVMATQEVEMSRSTMARLIEQVGNTLAVTVVAAMFRHAKATAHVMSTDATGAWIKPEPSQTKPLVQRCDKGHFFVVVADADAILFFYEREHTQVAVERLFFGYGGYLQADASSVYHLLERGPPRDPPDDADDNERVTLVGCWAHCRRYFFEAAQCRYAEGAVGLGLVAAIFAADKALRKKSMAEYAAERATVLAPLFDAFFAWVHATRAALPIGRRNLLTQALGYAARQEVELRRVLLDPRLPLDNTRAERALRTPVISRKNSLFHGSDTHAEAAAALFSILQTCRLHGLDIQAYLEDFLRLLPQWPKDRYLELAPNFWKATRARLDPDELARPIGWFTIPPPA